MTSKNLVDTRKELADLVKRKSEIAVSIKKNPNEKSRNFM